MALMDWPRMAKLDLCRMTHLAMSSINCSAVAIFEANRETTNMTVPKIHDKLQQSLHCLHRTCNSRGFGDSIWPLPSSLLHRQHGIAPFSNGNSSSTHVLTGMKSSQKKVEKYIHTNLMICCSICLGLPVAYIVDNFIQIVLFSHGL